MAPEVVTIHYRRLPDRVQIFEQLEIDADSERVVTLLESAALKGPVMAGDRVVLEPGAPVVWFTYPGRRHDIGRFHLADGTFTGFYANVITPVIMNGRTWQTTDLCLDVWMGADGELLILDEEELHEAVTNRWIDPASAAHCSTEAFEKVDTMKGMRAFRA